jgi:hypothetical protein
MTETFSEKTFVFKNFKIARLDYSKKGKSMCVICCSSVKLSKLSRRLMFYPGVKNDKNLFVLKKYFQKLKLPTASAMLLFFPFAILINCKTKFAISSV